MKLPLSDFFLGPFMRRTISATVVVLSTLFYAVPISADVGDWRTFTPLRVNSLAVTQGQVWAATGGGVLRSATATSDPLVISTTEGLSDNDVLSAVTDGDGTVWMGTEKGGLIPFRVVGDSPPVMESPLFLNIVFGEVRPEISSVRGMSVWGDSLYLAHSVGITVLNINTRLVANNYRHLGGLLENRDQAVGFVVRTDTVLWAGVGGTLARASISGGNLQDPALWARRNDLFSTVVDLAEYGQSIYVATFTGVRRLDGSSSTLISTVTRVNGLAVFDGYLFAATNDGLGRYDGTTWTFLPQVKGRVVALTSDPELGLIFATEKSGIRRISDAQGSEIITVPGVQFPPIGSFVYLALDTSNALWVSPGQALTNQGNGVYRFDGTSWEHWHHTNGRLKNHASGIVSLGRGSDGRMWVGGFGSGMVEVLRPPPDQVDSRLSLGLSNSIVRGFTDASAFGVFRDFALDPRGYMWIAVDGRVLQVVPADISANDTSRGLRLADPFIADGTINSVNAWQVVVDGNGLVWVGIHSGLGGLYIFDPGTDILSPNDDYFVDRISTSEPAGASSVFLPNNIVNTMATDNLGRVWVGTDEGLVRYEGTYTPSTQSLSINRDTWKISSGLPGDNITALAFDSSDVMWVGTTQGLAQILPSGKVVDLTNSKLISLNIASLAYDHRNGFLYIGTLQGMSRYEAYPPLGQKSSLTVEVLDNPYRLELQQVAGGVVTVGEPLRINVPVDARVSIYSLTGELVWNLTADRQQISWNGSNMGGQAVATGVYFIVVERGGQRKVSKVAVIQSRQ